MASSGPWSSVRPIIVQIRVGHHLKHRGRFLRRQLIVSFDSFCLLLRQNFLGHRLGNLPDTPRIPLAAILEIVVPALPTLIKTHRYLHSLRLLSNDYPYELSSLGLVQFLLGKGTSEFWTFLFLRIT